MTNTLKYALISSMALSMLSQAANAAPASPATPSGRAMNSKMPAYVSPSEKDFMEHAAQTNMLEVKLGELAKQKAESNDVKAFADRMIKDHTDAQTSLKTVAEAAGMTLPADINEKGKKEFERLGKLSGKQFDSAYMSFNLSAHKNTLSNMKKEGHMIKHEQLKSWDAKTIPTVEEHVKMAELTEKSVAKEKSVANQKEKPRTTGGGSAHY